MKVAAHELSRRVLLVQTLAGAIVVILLATFGPFLLLIPPDVASAGIRFGLKWAVFLGAIALLLIRSKLASHRFVLRALALGSSALEPDDVAELLRVPRYVVTVSLSLGFIVPLALVSPLRPSIIDINTALSFALLTIVIISTATLPLLVLVRAAVAHALELVPPDVMASLIERKSRTRSHDLRVIARLLTAIAMPVGFVAVGAALIAHAHVRSFDMESRERTAETIASVLEPLPSVSVQAGRAEAMRVAHQLGFAARVSDETHGFSLVRGEDGRSSLTVPFDSGSATIRFAGSQLSPLTGTDILVALVAVLLASAFGYVAGSWLTRDLFRARERLEKLGTDAVLQGLADAAPPARFSVVSRLNAAIDTLKERFRTFAEAHERAISAREVADRARSLLFASVSHDLRNPLNAILGFTTLVAQTPLLPAQRESLDIIESRGRELLVLIETILELARIEAGQVELARSPGSVASLIREGMQKGKDLIAGREVEIIAEVEPSLPDLEIDRRRLALALAALLGHSARSVPSGSGAAPIHIRATRSPGEGVEIAIEYEAGAITTEQVERLLRGEPDAASQRRYSGMTLGLSLARTTIELHDGRLSVSKGVLGRTRFQIELSSRDSP